MKNILTNGKEILNNCNTLIDLHLHLDGSISVKSARELAKIENIELPNDDKELKDMLMVSDGCRNLSEYLERFELSCSLMQSQESITLAVKNLCEELKEKGFIYAEIRFAPQKQCDKGMTQEEVVQAAIKGIEKTDFKAQLILCCMRDEKDNKKENLETVKLTKKYLGKGVCGCDLAGAEALFSNERYADIFEEARELNVPFTMHSGEALGAESVKKAIDFGAKRIGHGIRSIEDDNVVKELVEKKIPIEVCPTSNINTCIFEEVKDIPLMKLSKRGVIVTINADNMSVSNTDVREELAHVCDSFNLGKEDIRKFLLNSAEAAFATENIKNELKEKINKW